MLSSIELVDFKGLSFRLGNLAKVNIIVGRNGSGKTRVLQALGALAGSLPGPLPLQQVNQTDSVKFETSCDPGSIYSIFYTSTNAGYAIQRESDLKKINDVLDALNQPIIEDQTISVPEAPTPGQRIQSVAKQQQFRLQDGIVVDPTLANWLSSGTLHYFSLVNAIAQKDTEMVSPSARSFLFLVDELEAGIHPSACKNLIIDLIAAAKRGISAPMAIPGTVNSTSPIPIQLFITTHSPAVIAAAARLPDAKIYVLDEIAKNRPSPSPIDFSNGITGAHAMGYGGYHVGASFGDYFPDHIVIAEGSVLTLLREVAGGAVPYFEVRRQGDSNSQSTSKGLSEFVNAVRNVYSQPPFCEANLFSKSVTVVIDEAMSAPEKSKFGKGVNVICPSGKQLEDLYRKEWIYEVLKERGIQHATWELGTSVNKYLESLDLRCYRPEEKRNHVKIGALKEEFARYAAKQPEFK